ncbi:eukaryotic translation initiation factor 4 [Nannochloropsis oceanica]
MSSKSGTAAGPRPADVNVSGNTSDEIKPPASNSTSAPSSMPGDLPKKMLSAAAQAYKPMKLRPDAHVFIPGATFKPPTPAAGGCSGPPLNSRATSTVATAGLKPLMVARSGPFPGAPMYTKHQQAYLQHPLPGPPQHHVKDAGVKAGALHVGPETGHPHSHHLYQPPQQQGVKPHPPSQHKQQQPAPTHTKQGKGTPQVLSPQTESMSIISARNGIPATALSTASAATSAGTTAAPMPAPASSTPRSNGETTKINPSNSPALVHPQPTKEVPVGIERENSGVFSSSLWRRSGADKPSTPTSSGSSPFGGSAAVVAAPLAVKSYRASSHEDWERELQPAIPDAPAVKGMQQYYARDLLRIRRVVVEASTLGSLPTKPEGSDIPAEILNTEPPGASPIAPAADVPSLSLEAPQPQRARTPKVPEGLPRPRSTTGFDGPGGGGGGGGNSGRSTPRGDLEPPVFGRQSSRDRRGGGKAGGGGRGGGGGGGSYRKASPPLEEDGYGPKRIEEERRWRPESIMLRRAGGMDPEDPEKKIKRARALLNKLSMEKFDKLSAEFVNVGFTSDALLWRAIDIIVAKAQEEVHFSSMYAELCLRLSRTPLEGLGETDKGKLFRKILLHRCQEEFYEDLPTRMAKVDTEPETAGLGPEERAEKKRMSKFRYLGHMRFIGELFLKELLKEEHVHDCIKELFGEEDNPDEEKLACLCKLLSTTGKKLELLAEVNAETSKKQRRLLNKYFEEVKTLSEATGLLNQRTRCLLKDLYELRQNGYVPRRAIETAKTLSQVHEEAAREALAKGGSTSGSKGVGGGKVANSGGGGSRGGGGGSTQDVRKERALGEASRQSSSASLASTSAPDEDGWETVGSKKAISKSTSKQSLGRSASNNSLSGGSGAMKKTGSNASFGAFSVLQEEKRKKKEHKDKKEKEHRKEKKATSAGTAPQKREANNVDLQKAEEQEGEEEEQEELSSCPSPTVGETSSIASSKVAQPLSEVEFKRKGKAILADYLEMQDERDAVESMGNMKLEDPEIIGKLVGIWVDDILARSACKEEHRIHLADLMVILHKADLLPTPAAAQGLNSALEFLADIKVDIPKVEDWMAKIICRLLEGGVLSLAFLQALPQQMVQDGAAVPFALAVMREVKASMGNAKAKEMLEVEKLNLGLLVGPDGDAAEAQRLVHTWSF